MADKWLCHYIENINWLDGYINIILPLMVNNLSTWPFTDSPTVSIQGRQVNREFSQPAFYLIYIGQISARQDTCRADNGQI